MITTEIGTSGRSLKDFLAVCLAQVKKVSGEINKYDAELFVSREEPERHFDEFLCSGRPALVLTGKAGTGKSNQLCHMAAQRVEQEEAPALLMHATSIPPHDHGVRDKILENFPAPIWDAIRDELEPRGSEDWLGVLDTWLGEWRTELVVFIDAINEHRSGLEFRRCIEQAAQTTATCRYLRLFLSCRDVDWHEFGSTRALTRYLYYDSSSRDAHCIVMNKFTDDELEEALKKYSCSDRYKLGQPQGTLRDLCHDPLMLKFTAEAYAKRKLPEHASREDIFHEYLKFVGREPGSDHKDSDRKESLRQPILELALAMFRHRDEHLLEPAKAKSAAGSEANLKSIKSEAVVVRWDAGRGHGGSADANDGGYSFVYDAFFEYALARALLEIEWCGGDNWQPLEKLQEFIINTEQYRFREGTLTYLLRALLMRTGSDREEAQKAALIVLNAAAEGKNPAQNGASPTHEETEYWKKFYCTVAVTLTDEEAQCFAPVALDRLLRLAEDESAGVRWSAGTALGTLVSAGHVVTKSNILDELAADSSLWQKRETAAATLGPMYRDFNRVEKLLAQLANDINWRVRRQAGNTLSELCRLDPDRAQRLMEEWADGPFPWRLRRAVAQARTGLMKNPGFAMRALGQFIHDNEEDLRWRSVNVLANLAKTNPGYAPKVIEWFQHLAKEDPSIWVRRHVAFWLPDVHRVAVAKGQRKQAEALVDTCLDDSRKHVLWATVRALGEFDDHDTAIAKLKRVQGRDRLKAHVAFAIKYSLMRLEVVVADDQSGTVRADMEGRKTKERLRSQIEQLARTIRDPKPEDFLRERLDKEDHDRYTNIQNAIKEALESSAVAGRKLYERLSLDEDEGMRWGAADALAKQPGLSENPKELEKYVKRFTDDYQYWVRRECLTSVAKMIEKNGVQPSVAVVDRIVQGCGDKEAEVRFAALACVKALQKRITKGGWSGYNLNILNDARRELAGDSDAQIQQLANRENASEDALCPNR